jgi:hypothetical protein
MLLQVLVVFGNKSLVDSGEWIIAWQHIQSSRPVAEFAPIKECCRDFCTLISWFIAKYWYFFHSTNNAAPYGTHGVVLQIMIIFLNAFQLYNFEDYRIAHNCLWSPTSVGSGDERNFNTNTKNSFPKNNKRILN